MGVRREEFDHFIAQLPDGQDARDRSGLCVWSSEGWVIRVLSLLQDAGKVQLPCSPEELYTYMKGRIAALRSIPPSKQQPFPVVSLIG